MPVTAIKTLDQAVTSSGGDISTSSEAMEAKRHYATWLDRRIASTSGKEQEDLKRQRADLGRQLGETAPSTTPPLATFEADPAFFSKRGLKIAGYNTAERLLTALPTAGGMGGGLAGAAIGTPLGGPAGTAIGGAEGAGAGGALGKLLEMAGRRVVFGERPGGFKRGATSVAGEAGTQALLQLLGEGIGQTGKGLRSFLPAARESGGIPLLESEATGGRRASMFEHFMERSLPGVGPFERFRSRQLQAIVSKATSLVDSLSALGSGLPQESRGRLIREAIQNSRDETAKLISRQYEEVDKLVASHTVPTSTTVTVPGAGFGPATTRTVTGSTLVGGAIVEPTSVKRAAEMILTELEKQERYLNPVEVEPVMRHLRQIAAADKPMEFMTSENVRSTLLSQVRKYDDVLGNKKTAILRMLEDGLNADQERALSKASIPGAKSALLQARGMARTQHELFESALVDKIAKSGRPEDIAAYVRGAGIQEVRDLRKVLGETGGERRLEVVAQKVMQDMLDETLHAPTPQPTGFSMLASSPKSTFRGDKLAESFRQLGDTKAKLIFGDNYPAIQRFVHLIERVHPSDSSWVALHNAMYIAAAVHPALLPTALGEAAGTNLMSRAITNPKGLNAATRYFVAIARHAPQAANLALREFAAVARDQTGAPDLGIEQPVPPELRPGPKVRELQPEGVGP